MDGIIEENIKTFSKGFVDNQSRIAYLEQENKKLKEEKEIRALNDRDNLIQIEKLEQENKKLKEKVKELEEGLDRKEEINKKLRSDLLMYQNQYGCLTD